MESVYRQDVLHAIESTSTLTTAEKGPLTCKRELLVVSDSRPSLRGSAWTSPLSEGASQPVAEATEGEPCRHS